jgi:hypothetical protein
MKIKRWSTSGDVTDVLPSSSTVPAAALTSSVPLTVGDGADNAQHGTENESDGSVSNDTGERESDKDCVLIDVMETVIAHEETGSTIGQHAATGGTQDEASSKKTKRNMTAEQETFVQKFKSDSNMTAAQETDVQKLTPPQNKRPLFKSSRLHRRK